MSLGQVTIEVVPISKDASFNEEAYNNRFMSPYPGDTEGHDEVCTIEWSTWEAPNSLAPSHASASSIKLRLYVDFETSEWVMVIKGGLEAQGRVATADYGTLKNVPTLVGTEMSDKRSVRGRAPIRNVGVRHRLYEATSETGKPKIASTIRGASASDAQYSSLVGNVSSLCEDVVRLLEVFMPSEMATSQASVREALGDQAHLAVCSALYFVSIGGGIVDPSEAWRGSHGGGHAGSPHRQG